MINIYQKSNYLISYIYVHLFFFSHDGQNIYSCQSKLTQKQWKSLYIEINRQLAATLIDCANYATTGDWSYIIYDVDFKCYDANPDQALYSHSGNLILPNDQQIYFASKEKVFTCDVACIACYGPTSSDCIECVSPSRGSQWYPTVADIISKKTMDCPCRSGYSSSQTQHCTCPQGKYEVKKTNALWDCFSSYLNYLGCPFIYVTCTYDYGRDQVTPLTCKTGIGRSSDPNLKCNCENGYHENSPIIADCIPDCQKPCSLCQAGSNKLCSQCYDGLMLLNSTTFECLCPTQYYMNLQDFKCYGIIFCSSIACDYTCMTCNGGSNANCQSCIPASQRQLLSGYCLCPEHYVISSQLNCVQCDWSCNTCFSTSSCQTCMPNDNRYVGPSGYCVCQDGFAEDLGSATCVKCKYTCLTCEYQYDTCTSCPQNSMRLFQNSQCICQDYYYDAGNLECQQCDFTCQQCDGPLNNHCLKCDSAVHRFLTAQKQCLCLQGYGYIDESILECQLCSIYCLTCDQIDKCLTCPQNTFRIVDDNQTCICDTGYYQEHQQLICLQCHFTCQTCDGGGPDKCLSCNYDQGRELNNNQCKCQVGYYEFYKICTPCFYTCLSCVNQFQDGCTSCPSSRKLLDDLSPSQCVCNSIAQIDDGKSLECTGNNYFNFKDCDYTCQTCYGIYSNNCITCYENSNNPITTSRELKYGSCNCPLFWFDDGQSESCKPCHYSCQSCFDQTTQGCITCSNLDFRVQLSNSCFCQDGYFEIEQQTCQKCDYRCETCVQDKTNCLTCPKGSLRNLTLQNNSTGYQTCACTSAQPNDMQDNPVCQACHFSCSNCTKPQSNFCTMCSDQNNRRLIQEQLGSYCYCKDSYYEVGTSECASCSSLCYKCITTASNCTECDPNMFRVLNGNTCICGTRFGTQQLSYYDNNLDPECIACHYSCYTCSGEQYNQCLSCSELDFRNQQGSECVCNLKYIDNGEPQCMSCNYSCDTCEGTKYNCTSCLMGSLRVLNVQSQQCECPLGYYDSGVTLCAQCDIVCDSCSDQSTTCLSCVIGSNRVYNPLTYYCDCLSGYFDVGDGTCSICHLSCFQCNGPLKTDCLSCPDYQATQRVFNSGSCICADQYYDDSTNKICQICSSVCYTCQNDKNYCTQCIVTQNRTLFGSSCVCQEKYYDSGSAICQPCSDQCLECQNTSTQCKSCDTNLNRYLILSKCQCLDGYYEDLQLLCQMCHFSCQKCVNSSTNCTSCNQNDLREYNNGQCICIEGSIEQGTKLCGICDQRCKTCSSIATQCLSCDVSLKRILSGSNCVCIDGFFENNINQCQQCNSQCKYCINSELNCTFCDSLSHKVIGPQNSCICDNGYYTDSNNNCHLCSNLCLLCQESPTKCISCNLNRILVNNSCLCLDGSYNSGLICLSCSYTCKTCQISANNCTSCNLNQKRNQQGSQCICENGYYDIGSEICQICSVKCLTCVNDANNCQSCDLSLNRIQIGNQCSCQPGYFDNGAAICQVCDKSCATCNQQSNRCTSCNVSNTFRVDQSYGFNQCPCMIGFYDDQEAVCKKCSYQCINCELNPTNCTLCNNNPGYYRIDIIPSCVCQDGYFDDGLQVICEKCNFRCQTCTQSSQNCLTCENPLSRNQAPTCDCKQGYYLQTQTQKCLQCSIQCETCTENANNCKSCKPDRITKNCSCQDGYYEANLQNCQLCSPKCQICEIHQLNCKLCSSNRINPPNCLCKDHYYDDNINIECQICDQYCKNCNINGCIDCAANRILNGSSCSCPIDSISYLDTPWCSNCDVAVVSGRFSDDLLSLLYKFEFPILFHFPFQIDTQEYCEKIISQESLKLVGQSPKCLTQDTNLIIQLGDGATIQVNDKINFDSTYLRHPQCNGQLSMILRTEVQQPINLLKPQIELEYPQNPISPCSEIQISITKQFTSGQRNLIIQWQSPITLTDIEQANLYQFQTLTIQQGSLPENQVISFSLQFKNFLGQSDYLSINITTLSSNTPQFLFQGSQQQFFLWTPVKLIVFYSNQICSKYQTQKISDQIEINLQELSMYRSPLTSRPIAFKQSQFYFNDSENMLSVIIPAGTLSINSSYSIQASYKDSINNIQLSIQKDIQIQKSPLIVQIVGGTRIQNYLKDFMLEVQAKDPDFQTEWNVDPDIGVEVSCIDIQNNNQPCRDVKNRTIHLNNTQFTQNIGKRLFNPFSVIIFKTICKKQSLIGTDQVSIIFLDIDIPSLNVQYPLGYKIRDVNINEKLQFEIELSKYQYVKNIEFSYALVYNYEIVSVQSIPNSKLKFKIWDDFINFGNNNKISVRLQSHDINYLMPQTFSIQLTVNRPPVNSIISIQPQIGDAFFTQYKIKVQNAKDEDSPIQYHFAYYQSESLKNIDMLQNKDDNLITLQDFSSSQTYSGILESGDLVLLIQVSDSLGSTRNYTQQINSKSFSEQISQQNISCTSFIKQFSDQAYDYQRQIILVQELIKLMKGSQDCITEIKFLLSKLKQSMLIEMRSQKNLLIQQRINNALSQIYNIDYSNSRKLGEKQQQSICLDVNTGNLQFDNLNQINDGEESVELGEMLNSLVIQIGNSIVQNKNLLQDYQSSIDLGDEQTSRLLQQNFNLRQSYLKILGSLYSQAYKSKLMIRNLVNKLMDSFQQNIETDKPGIKLVTTSIGVQISKISQIAYQKYLIPDQNVEEILDLSTYLINRIVQFSVYSDNFYQYSSQFQNQFKVQIFNNKIQNGSYLISELNNSKVYQQRSIIAQNQEVTYDPFIYVEIDEIMNQMKKIYQGKLAINMKQEISQCDKQINTTVHKYSYACSTYDNEWKFDQCQLQQQFNKNGKIVLYCLCKTLNPVTLMILNETQVNKPQNQKLNLNINVKEYIKVGLNYNIFNIIILASAIVIILTILIFLKISYVLIVFQIVIQLETKITEPAHPLTEQPQMSTQLFKANFKFLHEILRIFMTRYTYLSQYARILLILLNIGIPLTLLNLFVTILGQYKISLIISLSVAVMFQVVTKIFEGFFTGPIALKIAGYILTIALNLGMLILNEFIIENNHQLLYDILSALLLLLVLYGPCEILIQYLRLKWAFQIYKEFTIDPMNPILNLIYYFFQDEIVICMVKGAKLS